MSISMGKTKALRIAIAAGISALILALAMIVLDQALPGFIEVLREGDQQAIEDYLRAESNFRGMALAVLLQFLQIISVVFPGGPIHLATGIIFGVWIGVLVCLIGYVAGNGAVFLFSRRFQRQLSELLPVEKEGGKGELITNSRHPAYMTCIACMLPFFPNGLIPHVAARTNLSFRSFILAISVGCLPSLLMMNAVGNSLLCGQYWLALVYGLVMIAAVLLLYFKRQQVIDFSLTLRERFFPDYDNDGV